MVDKERATARDLGAREAVGRAFQAVVSRMGLRPTYGCAIQLSVCLFAAWASVGCGYVVVKVTPVPPTLTATLPVRLVTPDLRATSTSVPSTPLPTSTPTATPTPVIHVVEKGDNLLALAFEYDVSVQALIEVNEIEDPRALSIGQALIIPLDAEALLTAQPTATPTPVPLRVVNESFHRTPVGSLWCMGDVRNDWEEPLDNVEIQVSLYNVDGELIGQETAFVATDIVPGNGKAPFAVLFPQSQAPGHGSYEITVLSAEPITHWGGRHPDLVVTEVEGEMEGAVYAVHGTVHNQGKASARDVRVIVTAYGTEGEVAGLRQTEIPYLDAGEDTAFDLEIVPSSPAVRAEAAAWGMVEGE
jgi:LysM repeat protein